MINGTLDNNLFEFDANVDKSNTLVGHGLGKY